MKILNLKIIQKVPKDYTGIIFWDNGSKMYYEKEKLHRLDGPAFENFAGSKFWYKEGELHRVDGPAVEFADGTKEWYKEGKLHREDGPAVEFSNGKKYWYKEDKLHRLDGPAIEYPDGTKRWWIDKIDYSIQELKSFYENGFYIGKEKGRYNLEWLRFLTEEGIREFPIIPGMELDVKFKEIFNKLSLKI